MNYSSILAKRITKAAKSPKIEIISLAQQECLIMVTELLCLENSWEKLFPIAPLIASRCRPNFKEADDFALCVFFVNTQYIPHVTFGEVYADECAKLFITKKYEAEAIKIITYYIKYFASLRYTGKNNILHLAIMNNCINAATHIIYSCPNFGLTGGSYMYTGLFSSTEMAKMLCKYALAYGTRGWDLLFKCTGSFNTKTHFLEGVDIFDPRYNTVAVLRVYLQFFPGLLTLQDDYGNSLHKYLLQHKKNILAEYDRLTI